MDLVCVRLVHLPLQTRFIGHLSFQKQEVEKSWGGSWGRLLPDSLMSLGIQVPLWSQVLWISWFYLVIAKLQMVTRTSRKKLKSLQALYHTQVLIPLWLLKYMRRNQGNVAHFLIFYKGFDLIERINGGWALTILLSSWLREPHCDNCPTQVCFHFAYLERLSRTQDYLGLLVSIFFYDRLSLVYHRCFHVYLSVVRVLHMVWMYLVPIPSFTSIPFTLNELIFLVVDIKKI